ncbi:MAG: glycoside hydrolase family 3 N-terminal domain-containing protein [Pseudomonadota bacterium]
MKDLFILSAVAFLAMQVVWVDVQPSAADEAVAPSILNSQQSAGSKPAVSTLPGSKPKKADVFASAEDETELKRKIGQMILVGFLGNDTGHSGYRLVQRQMKNGEVTGVLYLGRNLKNRTVVRKMNEGLKNAASRHAPPLIAIDQEGGKVQRLRRWHGFPQTPSAKRMAGAGNLEKAVVVYRRLAKNLSSWGFNLNLGPVVDLDINPRNPIIGRLGRSYSRNPDVVIRYSSAFIDGHRGEGVMTALKHFPGHGSSRRDSHKGMVDVSRTWSPKELEPFKRLISQGRADLIMTAHVHNKAFQKQGEAFPVSLSRTALSEVLRGELGFQGVIISDDLQMDAIRRNYAFAEAVVGAVAAGTDILLFANDKRPDPDIPAKVTNILFDAARQDPKLYQKIEASYERIRALKRRLKATPLPPVAKPGVDRSSAAGQEAEPETGQDQVPEDVEASTRSPRLDLPGGSAL